MWHRSWLRLCLQMALQMLSRPLLDPVGTAWGPFGDHLRTISGPSIRFLMTEFRAALNSYIGSRIHSITSHQIVWVLRDSIAEQPMLCIFVVGRWRPESFLPLLHGCTRPVGTAKLIQSRGKNELGDHSFAHMI